MPKTTHSISTLKDGIRFRHPIVKDKRGAGLIIVRGLGKFGKAADQIITDLQRLLDLAPRSEAEVLFQPCMEAMKIYFCDRDGKPYQFAPLLRNRDGKSYPFTATAEAEKLAAVADSARIAELEAELVKARATIAQLAETLARVSKKQ